MGFDKREPFSALSESDINNLFSSLPTPSYVIDKARLKRNGEIINGVAVRTGAKMLLAQKAFSNFDLYPVLEPYMAGTEASGLFEARLGREEMSKKEVHVFCGAYREDEMDEIIKYADHIVFNSPRQLEKFGEKAKLAGKSVGLRVNPECSTQEGHEIYDPCAEGSRLGVTRKQFNENMTPKLLSLLDGIHFHTLCEQNSDDLEKTLSALEEKFGDVLPKMKWLNFGGGHHITRADYDIETLEKCINYAAKKWGVQVYLEPGEAWALNAGYLLTRVLDLPVNGQTNLAILDMSAACHTPDVIEMPYRPPLYGAGESGEKQHTYRLGGPTCLSGDIIGDYSFERKFVENELLVFGDMAIYTTCKNNTFNGMPLPDIFVMNEDKSFEKLTDFGYADFKMRLGRYK